MFVARWNAKAVVIVLTAGLLSGCSSWDVQSFGDVFAKMIDGSQNGSSEKRAELRPIEQSLPTNVADAGTQMGLDDADKSGVEVDPDEVVKAVDLRGWDVAGLRFGMASDEVSDQLITRGYKLEHGAVWLRSEDRVATEFGPNGLMRAMSATLLPSEADAEQEVMDACQSARAAMLQRGCTADSEGASYEVSMAPSEDGWIVLREMEIDRLEDLE